jgi:hypothetical protein
MPGRTFVDVVHVLRDPKLALGHIGKEPYEAARREDDKMSAGAVSDCAKRVFGAAWNEGSFTGARGKCLAIDPQFHGSSQNDKGFIFIVVDMAWRARPNG